jgi:hypothetical protein
MDLRELVRALRSHETLAARQWVADAQRANVQLDALKQPSGLDSVDLAIAAGVVELLASRWLQSAPDWTKRIPALEVPFFLVKAAAHLPRLRKTCEEEGPEPLRRRRLLAPPDFLTGA